VIRLYNTLTGRKDPLKPVTEGKVGIYACGPTVYDYFHIGNARVFIFFDVLRRYLDYRGYSVTFVQNYTDIDDKMINKAREMGISVKELADIFIQAYEDDTAALGILPADHHPRATEHIPQIIDLIRRLIDKNLAYDVDGDIFYHVGAFPDYGQLSHQDLEELVSGVRVEIDQRKKHPMDFALWKREKAGEPSWESPWGRGRPGWHIECSAMSMHFLGETLDIHGGGQDLIFPHHENEIAQSQGATGKPFARHWVHVGYLNLEREKMSKSLGNVLTVRDLRKTIDPLALRFFMLSAHYRNPINFSREYLEQAAKGMERLNKVIYNLKDRLDKVEAGTLDKKESDLLDMLQDYREKFIAVMDDDLNTAEALAVLFELAKTTNTYLNRPEGQKKNVLEPILNFYLETDTILGFIKNDSTVILEKELEKLIAKREEYRRQKDWAAADAIRDKLKEQGIILEDTPQGVRWKVDEKKNARQRKI
jgi:cysteinyl-tRNA synthetase